MKKLAEPSEDLVQPFQLESGSFRGRIVRLGPALDLILHQHAYPDLIGTLLGEATVIAAALGTSLKHEGVFTLQVKGDGPVKLLVADVTSEGGIRAYAQFSSLPDTEAGAPKAKQAKLFGKGYLAFTYTLARPADPLLKDERYQGIVELEGKSLAEGVQHYFRQSEQLPTGIIAAVSHDAYGRWHGGCLMLQQMPREGGMAHESDTSVEDDWYRVMMLMGTCTAAELTDPLIEPNQLLFRLFHEEGVRVFDPRNFHHACRCSEKRVRNMLRSLPANEIEELAVNGVVEVTCEFCNKSYRFDEKKRAELYAEPVSDEDV